MKKLLILLLLGLCLQAGTARAQTAEVTQLILNIEKLSELRKILQQLKDGYDILFKGYNLIKDISEGNFKLHEAFLDKLLQVSPAVKGYSRVKDIIDCQLTIAKEYKKAYQELSASGNFSTQELAYIAGVYSDLTGGSLKNLEALTDILTAKKMRASDDQRLRLIDALYEKMTEQLSFLRHFNGNAQLLSRQRTSERADALLMQQLYHVNP